jgi:hypothetical protein
LHIAPQPHGRSSVLASQRQWVPQVQRSFVFVIVMSPFTTADGRLAEALQVRGSP